MLPLKDKILFQSEAQGIAVQNPATGKILGHVPDMGAAGAAAAVDAAARVFLVWREIPAHARGEILRRWADLIVAHLDDLSAILTAEQGKPLSQAQAEIESGAAYIAWMAEEGRRAYGDVIPANGPSQRLVTYRQPVGVCAMITPWNFPSSMIARKCGAALAAGCTAVVKPSELTPFSALALAVLAERAGLPKGVLNIVTGEASAIGGVLTSDARVRKLSFTGSTAVGKKLMAQCAGTVKKVSLELGGNAPFIVFEDADLDAAALAAAQSKFRNAGQTCICANRILVQKSVQDVFVEKFVRAVGALTVAAGDTPGADIGPLIDARALAKVEAHVQDAQAKGGKIVTGGSRHALGGLFFEPTVIADATRAMKCFSEEIFGPLAPVFAFADEAEALTLANDTEYGLAAYLYTREAGRIWRLSEGLEYGMVGVNTVSIVAAQAPFGGCKQSGMGREGGRQGLEEYLETKLVVHGL